LTGRTYPDLAKTRNQRYIDGVNTYPKENPGSFPLEFKLADLKPQPWRIEDALAIMYYMSWGSSANLQTEIIAQMLVDKIGLEKAIRHTLVLSPRLLKRPLCFFSEGRDRDRVHPCPGWE
jgi:acyl-homoserine lactone acylase PvdQ